MALTDDEANFAYSALSEAARECRLGWVLEQVEETIALGKTTVKKLPARGYPESMLGEPSVFVEGPHQEKRGAPRIFVAGEQYSFTESLELLIDALLLAVPTAHQVAQKALSGVADFGVVESMVFAADMPNREVREVREEQLASSSSQVAVVAKLLNELKAEL